MEITTIVGIVVAVIIMLLGIRLFFKKPADATPSLEADLHIDPDSLQPVIPRHVRNQLNAQDSSEQTRVEPTLGENISFEEDVALKATTSEVNDAPVMTDAVSNQEADTSSEKDAENLQAASTTEQNVVVPEQSTTNVGEPVVKASKNTEEKVVQELSLNQIEKAEITEFEDESNILDAHLHEQKLVDDESALATAETYVALNLYADSRALSGEKALKVLLKYGLRFGEMACFHRYSEDGKLLFSVLQISNDGAAAGFDLETLSTEQVKGLAFFLALPHSDVQIAFDTMDSISRLIAREIEGTVYDQNNQEFTQQLREHWRHQAIDYRPGQAAAEA